jgi:hypothetical protein
MSSGATPLVESPRERASEAEPGRRSPAHRWRARGEPPGESAARSGHSSTEGASGRCRIGTFDEVTRSAALRLGISPHGGCSESQSKRQRSVAIVSRAEENAARERRNPKAPSIEGLQDRAAPASPDGHSRDGQSAKALGAPSSALGIERKRRFGAPSLGRHAIRQVHVESSRLQRWVRTIFPVARRSPRGGSSARGSVRRMLASVGRR